MAIRRPSPIVLAVESKPPHLVTTRGPTRLIGYISEDTHPTCCMTPLVAPPSAVPRVAILGGGISGLTAAYRLSELLPQANIELFESSNRLGGILSTVSRGGFLIEQ